MEQRLLVIAGAIDIFDDEGCPLSHRVEQVDIDTGWRQRFGARARLPHPGKMGLAARRRPDDELCVLLPLRPGIDQADGAAIARADQEVFRAESRAMRQVEAELLDRHEALTRDCSGPLSGGTDLPLRAGSGAGSGS